MIDAIATFEGRIAKVSGPARSGKTEALVRRAATLLGRGIDPAAIMVVTSTAMAGAAFKERLDRIAGKAAHDICITTAHNACIAALEGPEARAATGRKPRTLLPFEYNFFLEDMKTLGLPQRRLRSLMRRLQKQWCALAPENEWLLPGEEQNTLDFALAELHELGAILPDEAAWLCATYLQSDAGRGESQRYAFVLCDDLQNLSRAQQTSICLMAREQLIVAGNADQTVACAAPFPSPHGFETFDTLRRGVETFELTQPHGNAKVAAFAAGIAAAGGAAPYAIDPQAADANVSLVKWNMPDEELAGLGRFLRAACNDSNDDESSFVLVAPNKRWARAMESSLARQGFAVSAAGFAGLGGDPRDLKRSRALQAYTLLNLLADPTDVAAWRCWCGFGNYLTNSDAWSELRAWAASEGLGLLDALAQAAQRCAAGEEPFLRANALAQRWEEGQEALAHAAGRRGFALLAAIGASDLREFADIAASLDGDEDAAALFALMRSAETDPVYRADPHAIRIASFAALTGCSYRHMVVCGCVDGFMPARNAFEVVSTDAERERILTEERRSFASGVAKAEETLMLSTFSKASLEAAETMKMQVARVRSENGERIATLRPTCFIAEAGAAAPTTVGGQTLLAQFGVD